LYGSRLKNKPYSSTVNISYRWFSLESYDSTPAFWAFTSSSAFGIPFHGSVAKCCTFSELIVLPFKAVVFVPKPRGALIPFSHI
jgi:hypothetical protein